MTTTVELTESMLDSWATDPSGPIALHLKQKLLSVGDEVIFPPTYADIGYNIDTLSDGTKVATIDSVGSQANRMEPIFKSLSDNPEDWLVPQMEIVLGEGQKLSILDLAHRGADAVVRSSTLAKDIEEAFQALQQGNAGPLCAIAPTSLVFGVWDSRGTGEKRPRLVRAIIRAWNVEQLSASAQFTSAWRAFSQQQRAELEKEAKTQNVKLSTVGFADTPENGLGGVLVRDRIEREVTVNLVALRGLQGKDANETVNIQRYLLGLSLVAATAEIDLSLREGCHLRYADEDVWHKLSSRGEPQVIDMYSSQARAAIESYTRNAAQQFRTKWPQDPVYTFEISKAKAILSNKKKKKNDGDTSSEE